MLSVCCVFGIYYTCIFDFVLIYCSASKRIFKSSNCQKITKSVNFLRGTATRSGFIAPKSLIFEKHLSNIVKKISVLLLQPINTRITFKFSEGI